MTSEKQNVCLPAFFLGDHMFSLTEEQQDLQLSMRRFSRREVRWKARKLDHAPPGSVDWELLRQSCDFGLISAQIPPDYGGTMDPMSTAIALEEIAHWDGGFATLLSANGLAQQALAQSGRQDLAAQVFNAVVQREAQREPVLGALAVTERHVGSDFINPSVSEWTTTGIPMV
jgi:alkylation response protein AidB-like acyl-CoA dehydrogenase